MAADNQNRKLFGETPSQTVGPFFHYGLPWNGGADLVGASEMGARSDLLQPDHSALNVASPHRVPRGEVIEIVGYVLDGAGAPVPDAMLELWQANAAGRYASAADPRSELPLDPEFLGFGRAATARDGSYRFRTVMPGRVQGPGNSLQAPHIALGVFGRGLLKRLVTRIYFEGMEGNELDPILAVVPEARRKTLMAQPTRPGEWRFDVVLQGVAETVFFAL